MKVAEAEAVVVAAAVAAARAGSEEFQRVTDCRDDRKQRKED